MARLSILLFSLLLVSCSVKKNTIKNNSKEQTKVSTQTTIIKKDSLRYDAETFEIVVEQKDSLKPISVVLNGVESTFSNAKSVTIRKKKESLIEAKNESKEIKQDSIVVKQSSEKVFAKEKSFSYKSLLPILFVFAFIILLRYIVSKFSLL